MGPDLGERKVNKEFAGHYKRTKSEVGASLGFKLWGKRSHIA